MDTFNNVLTANLVEAHSRAISILGDAGNGTATIEKGKGILGSVIAVISVLGGLFLVAVAILGIVKALKGDNKEWGKAGIELFVGILGGVLIAAGSMALWQQFFTTTGTDFNIVGKAGSN